MATDSALYAKVSRHILPVLFLTYFINFLDRVNVSFASLSMGATLGIEAKTFGFAAGLFFIGYFFFEVPSNLLLYRYGARRWLAILALCWGVLTTLTAFIHAPWQLFLLRFLLGVAECGFFPGVILYLTWWYPKEWRVRIVAGFISAIPISGVLGGPLSGWIMSQTGGGLGLEDWRWLFLLEAIPCFGVGLWIWYGLADRPSDARWLSEPEKAQLAGRLAEEESARLAGGSSSHASQAFSDPIVWKLSLLYFCQMMGLYGLSFWLPQIIKGMGWTNAWHIGLISAVPWLCAIVLMFVLGNLSDRTGERRRFGIVAASLGAFGFLASAWFSHPWLRIGGLALAASGVMALMAISWSFPATLLSAQAAAAGIALINSFGNLGGFVSPTLIGLITPANGSLSPGMVLTGFFMALAGLFLLCFRSLQPVSPPVRSQKTRSA